MSDFVDDLRERAITACTALGITREVAAMVANELATGIAHDYRGDRPYIGITEAARMERSARDMAIRRDSRRGESLAFLSRRYGLSKGRICQIINGSV